MNSYLVYRASFYLMLVVASLALVGDSTEGQFAKLYTAGRDGRWNRRVFHGRSAPAVGPAATAGQRAGRRNAGLALPRIQGRRNPDDSGRWGTG